MRTARMGATVLLLLVAAPGAASASTPSESRGAILGTPHSLQGAPSQPVVGRVVDPEGSPLPGVTVRAVGTYLTTLTEADGRFRMKLPESVGRLRFRRVGYRTRTVDVSPAVRSGADTLRVTLVPHAVELKGLTVEGERTLPGDALGSTVTRETVRQAPALGESDVFRALVHLPGVSQPNDLKGRIHLAGGSSDETGYRLDGHPLQEPFHLLGLLGAFNVASLERAEVRSHRYPISEGGRLSGLIDMRTRRARGAEEPSTEVVGSLLSSSFTTVRPEFPGGFDLLASGRVTYLDRVAPLIADDVPRLGYYDGLVRLGRTWSDGWRAELLGFTTRNALRSGEVRGVRVERDPLRWGESLAGVRLERSSSDWRVLLRGSFNRATTGLDRRPRIEERIDATRDWWSAEAEVERRGESWRATAGLSVDHRRHEQSWTLASRVDELFSPGLPSSFSGTDESTRSALFGEATVDLTDRLSATAGTRILRLGDSTHVAPRGLLSYVAGPTLTLEASAGRRLQFDAEIAEPVEGSVTPPRFLLTSPRRATVLASAAEWAPTTLPLVGTEGRIRVVGFWKRYPDRPLFVQLDPLAPVTEEPDFSDFPRVHRVEGRSVGVSAEVQFRIADGGLFQGSYTYQRALEEVEGTWSPTTWDAPHDLSLFASVPVFGDWTLNGAYRLHSGRAITPVVERVFTPNSSFTSTLGTRFFRGERNSARLGRYSRLDLGVRHRFDWLGADWVFFGQALNVFWSRNPIDLRWGTYLSLDDRLGDVQKIDGGLPLIPSFGVEVSW